MGRLALILLILGAIAAFFLFDLGRWLTFESLKARQAELAAFVEANPLQAIAAFFLLYVAVTALSLPGAAIMTLAAGAIFGLWRGTLIVSFASTIGASLAFLSSRYVLRDWVKARFGARIDAIDRGIERDGAFYLLTLRLIPAFPFFLINLAMGLTAMRLATFYLVSQAGMLPGTIVYVNAGTQLAALTGTAGIFSPALIGSFVLLGLFPLVAKFALGRWKRRRIYKGWRRPKRFDRNLIVIGAGAGGLVTAYIGATVRAKVTLIEKGEMGGDCLNTGCVPSKTLIACAKAVHQQTAFADVIKSAPSVDFRAAIERVFEAIRIIAPADSVERYTALGVDVRQGHARIVDPWTVEVAGERLTTRAIVIAAGGEPLVPPIPGLAESGYLTSDTMWSALRGLEAPPRRLSILGGGPIGVEMAQAFARLGSDVTIVEAGPRLLSKEDEEGSTFIEQRLKEEGVRVLTGHEARGVEADTLLAGSERIPFDTLIVALGRRARLTGYGLEELGIETNKRIVTNDWLETLYPNIYAVGDVAGPYQFTHVAAHQAWFAAVNALFGNLRRFRADYRVIPWVTYTDPEVAHVGHNELSAREAGVAYELVRYDLSHLDRAVSEGTNQGFVKLLVEPGKDRILGATIVAAGAGEMLAELVLAMKHGIGLNKILGTIHAYPTMAEANKYAAGEWKKAHAPTRILALLERYHRWRR
ncbi:MAG: pyridine nucleotide-disulfide oxidoreductase [Alphaproteobacteria bacterium]|nr:MAG: pyridine nucleotide-disulfide oxidoreductase [Alphaproteobacteria bacterium]